MLADYYHITIFFLFEINTGQYQHLSLLQSIYVLIIVLQVSMKQFFMKDHNQNFTLLH